MPNSSPLDPDDPKTRTCGLCGTSLAGTTLGAQCPRCLLSLASSFGLPDGGDSADDLLNPLQVRNFGDYDLISEIARGGMGIVYRAWQISLSREVAIKMILAGELAGKRALRMFQVEAHAAAKLHHPNIVPVYEIGEHETQHYFTMRFVPGGETIADWAKEHRQDYRAISAAAAKVARAVEYAHMRSILHRDLKPSNILWDPEAGPQVTDFGLAKLLDNVDGAATRSAQAIGSPSYMAPEQMDGRAGEITTATDVYGLGAVLYELLSGRPPFGGASAIETMRRVAMDDPEPLIGVPRDLQAICLKCLAKNQKDRYPSARELAKDLERFARGEPVSVVPITALQALWRWARRQPRMAALLALCVALMLAGSGGILWQWRKAELARADQERALAYTHWMEIDHWLDEGDAPAAIAYLASIIRQQPGNWSAVMYAMSILDQTPFSVLAGPEIHPTAKLVCQARLAPDGTWLAGAGEDRIVRVWETNSGKEIANSLQSSPVTALAVSARPAALAVAMEDGAVTIRGAIGAPPETLKRADSQAILELNFSADGSRLIGRSKDRVEIWSPGVPGQPPLAFALGEVVKGASLAADGSRALLWNSREAAVWETTSGRELLRVSAAKAFHRCVIAAGGSRVAVLDGGVAARVWNVSPEKPFRDIEIPSSVTRLELDASGSRLTLAGDSNKMSVRDVESGLPVSPPMKHHYSQTGLEISPDGWRTVSLGLDRTIKVWDAATGRSVMTGIPVGGSARRSASVISSHDGSAILVHAVPEVDAPETLSVWRATRKSEPVRRTVDDQRDFDGARLSPDGRLGCLGLWPGNRCYVYELATGRVLLDRALEGPAYVHLFTPDSRKYYVLTANGWLHGWSLETGEALWRPDHQPGLIRPAALSPDGSRIIAGHNDGHIRVHDTATGKVIQTLDHPGEIKVLRFAPGGSGSFLSASTDRLMHIWDLRTGRMIQTFAGHTDTIISAAWSPDSLLIATASLDQTARVWDAATGRPVGAVMQHAGALSHLEFSPDGARLATACRDGSSRLWHPRTGLPTSPPLLQGSSCETVRFTKDGAALLVRDHDGFRFWNTEAGEPITVHYLEPGVSGLGMDAESYRAIMSEDGRRVFLGHSMNDSALWSITQTRRPAPAWMADFFEILAKTGLNGRGEFLPVPPEAASHLAEKIRQAPESSEFAAWAVKILGQ